MTCVCAGCFNNFKKGSKVADSLKAVFDDYKNDSVLRQLSKGKTFVPGAGSQMPALIIVGATPSTEDDAVGKAFVGKSGEVLDKLLAHISLDRKMVYVTHVIKWQPPINQSPTKEEIEAAKPYLRRELSLVGKAVGQANDGKPVRPIICLLGKAGAILKGKEFTKSTNRGQVIVEKSWRYSPLYHPASTMHDPKMLDILKADFRNIFKNI